MGCSFSSKKKGPSHEHYVIDGGDIITQNILDDSGISKSDLYTLYETWKTYIHKGSAMNYGEFRPLVY